jgi:hypothetical protein
MAQGVNPAAKHLYWWYKLMPSYTEGDLRSGTHPLEPSDASLRGSRGILEREFWELIAMDRLVKRLA